MIDILKNIAVVVGLIISCTTLFTLITKSGRAKVSAIIRKYSKVDESESTIEEVKKLLIQHIEDDELFRTEMQKQMDISLEFTKTQCRNLVKNIFYKYEPTQVVPWHEKKILMRLEELYVVKLNGNSETKALLEEMNEWDVDYSLKNHED